MYFWQRLGTDRALIGVPNEELIVPLCLKQCFDQLRINGETPLTVLLLKDHMSGKHGRQGLLNFLHISRFLLIELQFGTEFMHSMVELSYGFEILYAEVVPLMGSLREDDCLLLFIPLLQSKPESPWVLFHQILSLEIWMDVVPYDE
jgi:hypothetical protein